MLNSLTHRDAERGPAPRTTVLAPRRALAITAVLVVASALTSCGVAGRPDPTVTALDGGGGVIQGDDVAGGGGDPFPPDKPTTLEGWKARYQNLPWLADDVDNDDFFITGTIDGHEVLGFLCGYDGEPQGEAYAPDASHAEALFQSATDITADAIRATYVTFSAEGTCALPTQAQGTSVVVPSLSVSEEILSDPTKPTETSPADGGLRFEFLGVPTPDPGTCDDEKSALTAWIYAQGGY